MKSLAVSALFLRAALASSYIFGYITDPGCAPCLDGVIASGPGAIESKEFAEYLCLGLGGSEVALCITGCAFGRDELEMMYKSVQLQLLMGSFFDYCFRYYPEETCAASKGIWGAEAIVEVCSSARNGGANRPPPSAGDISAGSSTTTIIGTPTGTASAGSQPNRTSSSAPAVGPLASWEIVIGLLLLALNI